MTAAANPASNLARYCLHQGAQQTPEKVALLVISDASAAAAAEVWTYSDLEDAVLRTAGGLAARGFSAGERILIRLDNTSSYPILFLGAIAAGLVPIPASSLLTPNETEFLLADSEAHGMAIAAHADAHPHRAGIRILTENDIRQMMREAPRADYAATRAEDAAYIVYTSGTTAKPKGVVHAHRVALGRRPMYQGWYGINADDRVLHAGAFNWTYTLGTGLIDPWANGATSIIFTGEKTPQVWTQLIVQAQATIFAAVPSLFRQILKYAPAGPLALRPLRHGLIAGERPPDNLFDAWKERTGTELYEALGMSELSTYVSTSPTVPRKAGTTGKAQPGRRVSILPAEGGLDPLPFGEDGLIAVDRTDPGLMLGYWKRAEEEHDVFRGPWFIGGDIGRMDADGYITHVGRANDIMKALGYRVSPQEVEAVLLQCPGVAEVACCEINVRSDVSVIGAFIVRAAGAMLEGDRVSQFAQENLASYKQPREIMFVETLPRTPNGKVKRSALAALRPEA